MFVRCIVYIQAAADGARKIYLHVLTDGRDVPDGY